MKQELKGNEKKKWAEMISNENTFIPECDWKEYRQQMDCSTLTEKALFLVVDGIKYYFISD